MTGGGITSAFSRLLKIHVFNMLERAVKSISIQSQNAGAPRMFLWNFSKENSIQFRKQKRRGWAKRDFFFSNFLKIITLTNSTYETEEKKLAADLWKHTAVTGHLGVVAHKEHTLLLNRRTTPDLVQTCWVEVSRSNHWHVYTEYGALCCRWRDVNVYDVFLLCLAS